MTRAKEYTLVTGAGSGIGLALVEELVGNGCPVIAHVHSTDSAVRSLCKKHPQVPVVVVRGEFSSTRGIFSFIKKLHNTDVAIRNIVHCAALHEKKEYSDVGSLEVERIFSVNAIAPLLITQEVHAKHPRLASVVFMGTMYTFSGGSSRSLVYTASKSSLVGLARTMALRNAPSCRVNVVIPGFVDSPLLYRGSTAVSLRAKRRKTPLKRFVRTAEVVSIITYLLSTESEAVTGQALHVNGGLYFG